MQPAAVNRNISKEVESFTEVHRVFFNTLNTRMQASKGHPSSPNYVKVMSDYCRVVENLQEIASLLQLAESKLGPGHKTFIKASEGYSGIVEAMKEMLGNMSASSQPRNKFVCLI